MIVTANVIMKSLFSPNPPKQDQTANWVSHSANRICNFERSSTKTPRTVLPFGLYQMRRCKQRLLE